jgi:carbamoyl-phosphate synthase large subunit
VRGLLNVQYAVKDDVLYVLEANPRASRTVPFVSKATAVQVAKAAARIMLGTSIAELRAEGVLPAVGDGADLPYDAPISVKEAVLPFGRFRTAAGDGVDTVLGPEMKSTGEVMGIDRVFGTAYAKSQAAAYGELPTKGVVFVSVANRDKRAVLFPVKRLADLGFQVLATEGTADVLRRNGVEATVVGKHSHGLGDDVVPLILAGEVDLILNTPFGVGTRKDGYEIRTAAVAEASRASRRCRGRGLRAGHRGAGARRHRRAVAAGAPPAHPPAGGVRPADRLMPLQVAGEVLLVKKVGAYQAVTVVAPGIPELTRPGHFLAVQVGGPDSSMLLRRAFAIYDVKDRGVYGGTVEFVFAVHGRGTAWLSSRRQGDALDVVGPLGRPFRLPKSAVNVTLVGGGYGSAPLLPLAVALRERGLPGRRRARRRAAPSGCSASWRPSGWPTPSPSAPTTARWGARPGDRPAARGARPQPGRRRLRLRADADAARGRRAGRRAGDPQPGGRRGVDGLRHRVCMTCVLPVVGPTG